MSRWTTTYPRLPRSGPFGGRPFSHVLSGRYLCGLHGTFSAGHRRRDQRRDRTNSDFTQNWSDTHLHGRVRGAARSHPDRHRSVRRRHPAQRKSFARDRTNAAAGHEGSDSGTGIVPLRTPAAPAVPDVSTAGVSISHFWLPRAKFRRRAPEVLLANRRGRWLSPQAQIRG